MTKRDNSSNDFLLYTRDIKNIFTESKLQADSVVANFATRQKKVTVIKQSLGYFDE